MSLSNPTKPVTEERLQEFYHKIVPYMGGSSTSGGHTIEDSEGTELEQREVLQFGEGFKAEDDDTNEKTVISPDIMQSGDMNDVITPLPSVAPKKEGIKYSTTEQVIGEWIDGATLYEKTYEITAPTSSAIQEIVATYPSTYNVRNLFGNFNGYPLVNYQGANYYSSAFAFNGNIYMEQKNMFAGMQGTITIQYTKTTDTPNT